MSKQLTSATLPANNIGQQLFFTDLPNCTNRFDQKDSQFKPAECCTRDIELQKWYNQTPTNLWDTASNYEGEPPFNACTETAFARQCFMSQYYNYLSKNNQLNSSIPQTQ